MPDEQLLRRLKEWAEAQAAGEWRHAGKIAIESPDNPGWMPAVDRAGSDPEHERLGTGSDDESASG